VNVGSERQGSHHYEPSHMTSAKQLPTRSNLLQEIATRLWNDARAHVTPVLATGPDAAPHPLGLFIVAQRQFDPDEFQLPEPLLGPVANATQVLVVGLNPGYESSEDLPRWTANLDDYVHWYAFRMAQDSRDEWGRPASSFGGAKRIIRHYHAVERDYLDGVVGPQALGRVAVYADAIPWKWNAVANPDLGDPVVAEYARSRIAEIAAVLQPNILVSLGVFAADALGLSRPNAKPNAEICQIGWWRGCCLPVFHPNKLEPTAATWVGGVLHPARLTVLTAWIGRQIAQLDLSAVPRVFGHG
jgi:hypothetical protein